MPSPMEADEVVGPKESRTRDAEARLEQAIVRRISEPRYDLWFRPQTRFILIGDELVVGVPSPHFHDWLQRTFGDVVREAALETIGPGATVRYAVDPALFVTPATPATGPDHPSGTDNPQSAESNSHPKSRSGKTVAQVASATRDTASPKSRLRDSGPSKRRWKTAADFVVGACNRVAHAAAMNVVEEPGAGPNPLVFYGPTGNGKTHLLESIHVEFRRRFPEAKVVFVTAEEFMNRFVSAMYHQRKSTFRRQFRECFALLVDDVGFLAGKKQTQVEFLHTIDTLINDGAQVVLTADCHLRLNEDLMPELADRLVGGASWSLMPPDEATRLAMLRRKTAERGDFRIGDEVLQYVASKLRGNVRELEGALHGLRHYLQVTGRPVTVESARDALGDLLRHSVRTVLVEDIDSAVTKVLQLQPGVLRSKVKTWTVSHGRMLAMFLARRHTTATYAQIGEYFRNKTHSTAVANEKRVRTWVETNSLVKAGDRSWPARDLVEKIEHELFR